MADAEALDIEFGPVSIDLLDQVEELESQGMSLLCSDPILR
jgi:hypothetical protein